MRSRLLAATVAASLGASVAAAQTAPEQSSPGASAQESTGMEEVLVSARRKEERAQDVPVSIAVITSDSIERQSLFSLREAGNSIPNLDIRSHAAQGSSAPVIMLRGVGQLQADLPNDPGVGVYVDGVYMGRNQGVDFDLLDLERVEILRGPQGTLFGRNTTGGALNITSKRPTQEFEGRARVAFGSLDRRDVDAQLNIPLSPTLAARISASSRKQDGFGHRADFATGARTGDFGDVDRISTRAQLLWSPSDTFELLGIADYSKTDQATAVRSITRVYPPAGPIALLNTVIDPPYDSRFVSTDRFTSYATGRSADQSRPYGASVTATWSLADKGLQTVKSITSYRNLETLNAVDYDGSPYLILDTSHAVDQEQISQEFQLSGSSFDRLEWTGGLYYFWEDANLVQESPAFENLFLSFGRDVGFRGESSQVTRSYAAYGQGTYSFTDRLGMTLGLRYTHENKEVSRLKEGFYTGAAIVPFETLKKDWDAVTPRIDLNFRWTPTVMTYASVAEGFRSGGFNSNPATASDRAPFDPEYLWTYELGMKSDWFGRRLRVNTAVFYSDYKDMQFVVNRVSPAGTPIKTYENAGSATIQGFELETVAMPLDGLRFTLGVGYTDAKYTDLSVASGVQPDSRFPNTPEWSTNVGAEYTVPVSEAGALSFRVDYSRKSSVMLANLFATGPNNTPIQPDYGVLDARVSFDVSNAWTVAAFGRNLTNERYFAAANDWGGLGFVDVLWGRPREYGLSISYAF